MASSMSGMHLGAQSLDPGRDHGPGTGQADRRAHLFQRVDVGAGHPAVGDVADDGDGEPSRSSLVLADGQQVEQSLAGMLVGAVAGIDNRAVEALGQIMRGARGGMPHDDDIGMHRLDVPGGIFQGFPFDHRRGRGGDIDGVGGEPFAGDFKGGPGAGAGLEEEVDDRLAPQRRDFFDLPVVDFLEAFGGIEDQVDVFCGKLLGPKNVFMTEKPWTTS